MKVTQKPSKTGKREYGEIRRALLRGLAGGQRNINELATTSKVNWRTTRNHMIYLVGSSYARMIFSSPQVKIYEITENGMEALARKRI
jgi:predicted transcriptional regulator